MNISLPETLAAYVRKKVHIGQYATMSDVVRAAIRLLQDSEKKV